MNTVVQGYEADPQDVAAIVDGVLDAEDRADPTLLYRRATALVATYTDVLAALQTERASAVARLVAEVGSCERVGERVGLSKTRVQQLVHAAAAPPRQHWVLVVWRNSRTRYVEGDGRPYGELDADPEAQWEADRKWWPVTPGRRGRLTAVVYVVDGIVARIRAVDRSIDPDTWDATGIGGRVAIPVGRQPLTPAAAAALLPGLDLVLGTACPAVRGRIFEYLPVPPDPDDPS